MHNPAWRPAQIHTRRLAAIQNHFIEERPAARNAGKPGLITLPVHMAIAADHPADALQPTCLVDALTRELNIPVSDDADAPAWRLQTLPVGTTAGHAVPDFILVLATANPEGVRLAYAGIKKFSAVASKRYVVLFSGARDTEFAQRCKERLASGTRRFLGIDVPEIWHLPAPGPDLGADLARLAREIHRLLRAH